MQSQLLLWGNALCLPRGPLSSVMPRDEEAKMLWLHHLIRELLEVTAGGECKAPLAEERRWHLIPICMGLIQGI